MDLVPFELKSAEAAARIRTRLEIAGVCIGPVDVQIAGIAVAYVAVLITRNVREYSRVEGLLIENWYDGQSI